MSTAKDQDLEWFIEEFGQPTQLVAADASVIERFRGKLPERLLQYWQQLGLSGFANGLLWFTNPDDYRGALQEWVGDTPIMEEDTYYVIARSGFGALFLWGEKNGQQYTICPYNGWTIVEDGDRDRIATEGADEALRAFVGTIERSYCDTEDYPDEQPLFDRAVAKLGPLGADEIFAFEPSLIVGGVATLEHIAKRNIHVHLSLLRQFAEPEILDQEALKRKAFS